MKGGIRLGYGECENDKGGGGLLLLFFITFNISNNNPRKQEPT